MVLYTPGCCQNTRSAPQKHPSPNNASAIPCGNGGSMRWPLTECVDGTGIASALPGRASSWEGSRVLRKRSIVTPCARKVRIQCGPLPAADQAEARPFSTAQRCGMQPQAMCSIEVKEKAKSRRGKRGRRCVHRAPTTLAGGGGGGGRRGRGARPGRGAGGGRDGRAS